MSHASLLGACATLVALLGVPSPAATRAPARRDPGVAQAPAADSVVEFRLHDQFGRVHEAATYRGQPLIVVGAGRGGRDAGTAWVEQLRAMQGGPDAAGALPAGALPVVAVADLRGVPRLLRRLVRGRFPEDRARAVLLDWEGSLARRFGFDSERCTLLVVGPGGRAHLRTTSAAVDTALARTLLREAAALTATTASGPSS